MEFDKDLFISICKDYGVKFSDKYDAPMIRNYDGELQTLNEFLGFAKAQYDCDITPEPSDTPDTFKSIFGFSFINKEK
jgi:hypothetical protein